MDMLMYNKIKELAVLNRTVITQKQREEINCAMMKLQSENPIAYEEALEQLISETSIHIEKLVYKRKKKKVTTIL